MDLPGTYSLSANSEEELLAREYIIKKKPDLVVAVVDAATLERNLYLVAELLLLPSPVLLALNMMDVAEKEGIQVEAEVLEKAVGIPVVPMSASRGQGLEALELSIESMLQRKVEYRPNLPAILPAHRPILDSVQNMIGPYVPEPYPKDWVALKLLEGDEALSSLIKGIMPFDEWKAVDAVLYKHEDAVLDIAGARYQWIGRMVRAAVVEPPVSRMGLTTKLDRVLTHPIIGTLTLIILMGGVFGLTFSIGGPIQGWLSSLMRGLGDDIRGWMSGGPNWMSELVAGGVLGGLGMVLTFLPILAIFYLALGLLEDTGYMARAAYLTDRFMHMMGLHGKSFMPIILGFGCNVPAVLGTRIIESKKARIQTSLLVPFVPCTARLAVVSILAPIFFGHAAFWVTWGLVGGNLVILAVLGLILHKTAFEDEHVAFIMELPLYHLPNMKTIGIYVWQNLVGLPQEGGLHNPRGLPHRVGPLLLPDRSDHDELPRRLRQMARAREPPPRPSLAGLRRPPHELRGQGKHDSHPRRPLRRHNHRPSHDRLQGRGSRPPRLPDAFRTLRRHDSRHQARDAVHQVDGLQRDPHASPVLRRGLCDLPSGEAFLAVLRKLLGLMASASPARRPPSPPNSA